MRRTSAVGLAIWIVLATGIALAAPGPAYTSPDEAPADFLFQGEYVGSILIDGAPMKHGAQVIALGEGNFAGVTYEGGLPGAGGVRQPGEPVPGKLTEGKVVFVTPDKSVTGTLADGKITITAASGQVLGTLEKVERTSPTLGARPPAGATVLFDGTDADQWENGRVTPDGLLQQGVTSKPKFQSFKIHLEFRTPFMPEARGQARGNSGFYAQGRYEVQILDSFGLSGEHNECGGIYTVKAPSVNMCLPPLSWQTYDVEFTAARYERDKKVEDARMTVLHNGVKVQDRVAVPHATTAAPVPEGPGPGPIFLQDHGNPVRFRNVWVETR